MKYLITLILISCILPLASGSSISIGSLTFDSAGQSKTTDMILDSAPAGLSGYSVLVSISDPNVATISGVTFPEWASLSDASEKNGGYDIRGIDLNGAIESGAMDIHLATLLITASGQGTSTMTISPGQVDDDAGNLVELYANPASITVGTGSPPVGSDGTIDLVQGWNFIGISRPLSSGSNTASLFGLVPSDGHSIFRFDVQNGWQTVGKDEPLTPLSAFWIYSNSPLSIPVTYSDASIPSRQLIAGWSTIALPGSSAKPAVSALSSLSSWTYVIGFNSGMQQYNQAIINGASGVNSDQTPLIPGSGYWIYLSAPGTLGV